jgi:pimeloyl-ACP methyl ester carboxylesterase
MEKLGIEKSILCGLSLGGYIALNAVLKHPDRFDGLILNDTQCIADTPEIKENRCQAIIRIMKNGVEQYADEIIKNLLQRIFLKNDKCNCRVKEMIISTPKQSLCNTLHAWQNARDLRPATGNKYSRTYHGWQRR